MSHPFHLESFCTVLCIFITCAPGCPHWPDSPSPTSASLVHDHGEFGNFYPKGQGANGTISLALHLLVKEHIRGAPPGTGTGASLWCTTFQMASYLSQPLSPSLLQNFDVIPFCCQLTGPY